MLTVRELISSRLKMRIEIPKLVVHRCVPLQGSKKRLTAGKQHKHSFQNILTFECDKKVSHRAGRVSSYQKRGAGHRDKICVFLRPMASCWVGESELGFFLVPKEVRFGVHVPIGFGWGQ